MHTYQCPWTKTYRGTTSNVAAVVTAGKIKIEISGENKPNPDSGPDDKYKGALYTICSPDPISNKQNCIGLGYGTQELSTGDTSLPGRVTAVLGKKNFAIFGPPVGGQRGQVRGFFKLQSKNKIPTGYFWNLYGLLPESHALAADGLCKGEETCQEMHRNNPRIVKAKTMFQVGTLANISKTCSGTCAEGLVPPDCTQIKTNCELHAYDNPEGDAEGQCTASGANLTAATTVCVKNACSEDVNFCKLDYCISAGHGDVAVQYKEMQAQTCALACAQCTGAGGTCSSCTGASPSCDPTCTYPSPPSAEGRNINKVGCDSIQDKTECCSSYEADLRGPSNCVPGKWTVAAETSGLAQTQATNKRRHPSRKTGRGLDILTSMLMADETKTENTVTCQSGKWIAKQADRATKATSCKAPSPPTPGGCLTCDLVPCGYCQQGCPPSSCKHESVVDKANKKDRNGCKTKGTILNYGEVPPQCRGPVYKAPATPGPGPHQQPASKFCTKGIANDDVCCNSKCGKCETDGCETRSTSTKEMCCPGKIRALNGLCQDDEDDAPCKLPQTASAPPSAMPSLQKGMSPAPTPMPPLAKGTSLTQTGARKRLVLEHGKSRGQTDPLEDGESWL